MCLEPSRHPNDHPIDHFVIVAIVISQNSSGWGHRIEQYRSNKESSIMHAGSCLGKQHSTEDGDQGKSEQA